MTLSEDLKIVSASSAQTYHKRFQIKNVERILVLHIGDKALSVLIWVRGVTLIDDVVKKRDALDLTTETDTHPS